MRTIRIAAMAGLALLALDIAPARADVIECGRVSRFCREIIPVQCLKAVGAGSMPAPTGQAAELCESILGSYRSCLALVTGECRAGPAAETPSAEGAESAESGSVGASLFGDWHGTVNCADGRSWIAKFLARESVGSGVSGQWKFSGETEGEAVARLTRDLKDDTGRTVLLITEGSLVYDHALKLRGPDVMLGKSIGIDCSIQLER